LTRQSLKLKSRGLGTL